MLQKYKKQKKLNLIFITCSGILINFLGIILLPQNQQQIEAQSGIQVRTNQWLKVEKVVGNVKYRNLYNYVNRPARVGDLLQSASDEISTGVNSSAVLSIDTGVGVIDVADNTTLQIRSLSVASDNGRITNLFIPRGKARLQIRKFTNRGSQLNIQTPSGISGVRGTKYVVQARPDGNMIITTFTGHVATTAQNQIKMVNGGFQNLTIVGEPPSTPVPISNDASLKYVIDRQTSGSGRSIIFSGYTNPFNTVKVDGLEQSLDRSGKFSLKLPATSSLKVKVTVETSTGKIQVYEIPIL
jgi:hypothetical protein